MSAYYLMLHFWLHLGQSEFVIRSLSVIWAVAAIPILYFLAKELFDSRVAWIASSLMAINVFFIIHAQWARSYSFLGFLACASSYLFVEAVQRPTWRKWIAYGVVCVIAVYAHFFGAFLPIAHLLALAAARRRDAPWRFALSIAAGIVCLVVPLMILVARRGANQIGWIPRPSLQSLYRLFRAFSGGNVLLALFAVLAFFGLGIVVTTWRNASSGTRWGHIFVWTWLLLPIMLSFLISFAKPIFVDYYLTVSLPAFVLIVAFGLSRVRLRSVSIVMMALILGLTARSLNSWYRGPPEENWKSAVAFIASQSARNDAIFVMPYSTPAFYYFSRFRRSIKATVGAPLFPPSVGSAQSDPDEFHRWWILISDHDSTTTIALIERRLTALGYGLSAARSFQGGPVSVLSYAARGSGS